MAPMRTRRSSAGIGAGGGLRAAPPCPRSALFPPGTPPGHGSAVRFGAGHERCSGVRFALSTGASAARLVSLLLLAEQCLDLRREQARERRVHLRGAGEHVPGLEEVVPAVEPGDDAARLADQECAARDVPLREPELPEG